MGRTNHAVGSSCFSPCPGSCEWGRPGSCPWSQPLSPEKWKTRSPCRWLRTASSAPTEPSSTRTTSSATGGSTLTAPQLRSSTPSTTRSLQRGTPLQVMDWGPTEGNQSTELLQNTPGMLLSMRGRHLPGGEGAGGRGGGVKYSMKRERRALTMELTDGTESKD